jgi:hypothetical protein
MRLHAFLVSLSLLPACAHSTAGAAGQNPAPTSTVAADTAQIEVPGNVKGFFVFEVQKTTLEVHRQVGYFAREYFVDRFRDMRRQACARGWTLVVVSEAPPEDIRLNGPLSTVHITYGGQDHEGAQIPC